jgi:hypothetical protein
MCLGSSSPHVDRSRRASVSQRQLDFIVSRRDMRVREEARPSSVPGLRVDATVAQPVQSAERTACDDNAGRVAEFRARAQAEGRLLVRSISARAGRGKQGSPTRAQRINQERAGMVPARQPVTQFCRRTPIIVMAPMSHPRVARQRRLAAYRPQRSAAFLCRRGTGRVW